MKRLWWDISWLALNAGFVLGAVIRSGGESVSALTLLNAYAAGLLTTVILVKLIEGERV